MDTDEVKKNSYDSFWLNDDMETMSCIFEYSDMYAKECFNVSGNFDRVKFAEDFMRSNMRAVMETGHPGLLSRAISEVFERYVEVDLDGNFDTYLTSQPPTSLHRHQLYWVGYVYAYIHYMADITSRELIERLPLTDMLDYYTTGHQLSVDHFYEKVQHRVK